ncbi:benzyl alcohol O-benzoyltransferase-like [Typha latifolia]|uniref:benzyl alcohol O-benzoyltransferase-like n=1 Tax=Typha latifolia TaxID=4733 RepID=UPI003C2F3199
MASSLTFAARRSKPTLVAPARPTPHEFKALSDIDDQESLRFYRSVVYFYENDPSKEGQDPAAVVKDAVSKVLVPYYPFAGRIRERPGRKLVVECTGEGVEFVEADADVRLEDFGETLYPPIPCIEELLCLPESNKAVVVDRPLLYIQVTRLKCGGFIFGFQVCHNMVDAPGLTQFLTALAEFARGAATPSVQPVWARELLNARRPPRITHQHLEYEPVANLDKDKIRPGQELLHRPFFFWADDIAVLRRSAPQHLTARCSRFELIAAHVWRCRTAALGYDPDDEVRFQFVVNARGKSNPPLPEGYYGNALSYGFASAAAGKLVGEPLGYALALVMDAKARVMSDGYLQSTADFLVSRGRPRIQVARTYLVTDQTKAGLETVDVGWGKAVYGAAATTTLATFHMPVKSSRGEEGIMVPIGLPPWAMERFVVEMERIKNEPALQLGISSRL